MTATTAIPLLLLMGLAISFGKICFLYRSGTAAMIDVRGGCEDNLNFLLIWPRRLFRFMSLLGFEPSRFASCSCISWFAIS